MHTYIEKYTCRAGEADKLLRKSQAKFGDAPLPLGVRWRSERSGLDSGLERTWEFPKIRVPYLGVLMIRILLFRVLN